MFFLVIHLRTMLILMETRWIFTFLSPWRPGQSWRIFIWLHVKSSLRRQTNPLWVLSRIHSALWGRWRREMCLLIKNWWWPCSCFCRTGTESFLFPPFWSLNHCGLENSYFLWLYQVCRFTSLTLSSLTFSLLTV